MNYVNGLLIGMMMCLIVLVSWTRWHVSQIYTGEVETACAMTPVQVPAIENNGVAVIHFKCQVRR